MLECLRDLHALAEKKVRSNVNGTNEGQVYAWLTIAAQLTPTVWRDSILALKTRESDHITLGPVGTDGTCKRDMTEGCLMNEESQPTGVTKRYVASVSFLRRRT